MNAGGCGLGHSQSALSTAGQGPGPRSFINQSSGGRGGSLVGASLSEDGSNSNSLTVTSHLRTLSPQHLQFPPPKLGLISRKHNITRRCCYRAVPKLQPSHPLWPQADLTALRGTQL